MISHRQIMINAADAVRASGEIAAYCIQHFGRPLEIHVGAYPTGIPGEKEAPFLWVIPAAVENESVATDESFIIHMVVGGLVEGANGEKYIRAVGVERTETENGLIVNGGNKIVEDLRDMVLAIVRDARAGAIVSRIRRAENDISHFPLEWAEVHVDYFEPEEL